MNEQHRRVTILLTSTILEYYDLSMLIKACTQPRLAFVIWSIQQLLLTQCNCSINGLSNSKTKESSTVVFTIVQLLHLPFNNYESTVLQHQISH